MKILISTTILLLASITRLPAQQIIKGTYAIKNVQTGMLLRIKDANGKDGTPLVAYTPTNWKCMTWDFNHVDGNTYTLKNLFTGKTVQPESMKPNAGNALREQPINNSIVQQYEFIPVKESVYLIKLKGTELYVTPSDENGAINSSIILANKNGNKLQQWTIYEQHPTM